MERWVAAAISAAVDRLLGLGGMMDRGGIVAADAWRRCIIVTLNEVGRSDTLSRVSRERDVVLAH